MRTVARLLPWRRRGGAGSPARSSPRGERLGPVGKPLPDHPVELASWVEGHRRIQRRRRRFMLRIARGAPTAATASATPSDIARASCHSSRRPSTARTGDEAASATASLRGQRIPGPPDRAPAETRVGHHRHRDPCVTRQGSAGARSSRPDPGRTVPARRTSMPSGSSAVSAAPISEPRAWSIGRLDRHVHQDRNVSADLRQRPAGMRRRQLSTSRSWAVSMRGCRRHRRRAFLSHLLVGVAQHRERRAPQAGQRCARPDGAQHEASVPRPSCPSRRSDAARDRRSTVGTQIGDAVGDVMVAEVQKG